MDDKFFEQIKKASEDSIKNPGQNDKPLPKEESPIYPEIYVFRHGESEDNLKKLFSGWRDANLTDKGRQQAEILAEKLKGKNIQLCITSPQIRAKDTARIALKYHKDIVFELDQRIMERNYGDLTGQSKEVWMKENPELAVKYRRGYDFPPPHGESLKMVEERVFPFCDEVVERARRNNMNIAISCHGNSMRAIRRYFEKLSIVDELTLENPLAQDYAEYVVKTKKIEKSEEELPKNYLKRLFIPTWKFFKK
jgi:2,3-bisphosphoglycerate-dependent phosphoglycerate mutase